MAKKQPTQGGTIREYAPGDWLRSAVKQKTLNPNIEMTGKPVRRRISGKAPKNIYNTTESLVSDSAIKRIRAQGGSDAVRAKARSAESRKPSVASTIPASGGREYEAQQSIVASIPTSVASEPKTPKVTVRGMTPQSKEAQQTIEASQRSGTDMNVNLKSERSYDDRKGMLATLGAGTGGGFDKLTGRDSQGLRPGTGGQKSPTSGASTPAGDPPKKGLLDRLKSNKSDFLKDTEYEDLRF